MKLYRSDDGVTIVNEKGEILAQDHSLLPEQILIEIGRTMVRGELFEEIDIEEDLEEICEEMKSIILNTFFNNFYDEYNIVKFKSELLDRFQEQCEELLQEVKNGMMTGETK